MATTEHAGYPSDEAWYTNSRSPSTGTLLVFMLQQALLYARGMAPPTHPSPTTPYPPLSPMEAMRRSQSLVDEVTTHCDMLACIMQEYSGKTMAHEARVQSHVPRLSAE